MAASTTTVSTVAGTGSSGAIAAITSGTIANATLSGTTNAVYVLSQTGIPFIKISSGSIGNNGALTAVTALPRIISTGAYCYYPTNSISAATPAGWYWTVFSSTTAGTIYNSTYTTGTPVAGTLTAFATTGPGAFTGDVTEQGITVTIPAGAMGPNGKLRVTTVWEGTSSGNNKTKRIRLGGAAGTAFLSNAFTTAVSVYDIRQIANVGLATAQVGLTSGIPATTATAGVSPVVAAVDTSASTTLVISAQNATATENMSITNYCIEVLYGA